ncbi:hypothetical protein AZI86_09715 [Bdellovibrio bacteriovorus]|uniref:Secreted protein n=1 Tax=Bdellovibrio bacteriovorus TaxID=959 RepID=A0A150WS58_BDEBC|nr:hypothetical protein [Bdellovibrio bacteriovorus]KYG67270.1 hypothetical protein AZI86_09715 [Bdellovibrio bacteriovorus]
MKAILFSALLSLVSLTSFAAATSEEQVAQLGKSAIAASTSDLQELPFSIDRLVLQAVISNGNRVTEITYLANDFESYENCSFDPRNDAGSCDLYRCQADVRVILSQNYTAKVKTENVRNCKFVEYVRN